MVHEDSFMGDKFDGLRDLEYVKNVKNMSDTTIKINLFTRDVGTSELKEIKGDLRSIGQNISSELNSLKKEGEISGWRWMEKPEKKYQETSLGKDKLKDRKPKGHKPGYYRVFIKD